MSEFSESFHLRSDNQQNGEDLLRRAGLPGAVFSPVRGWVTVVPESEMCEAVDQMVTSNQGLLLHYLYAEDHDWQFALYKDNSVLCQYECVWDPEFAINDSDINQAMLVSLLIEKSREKVLENILYPQDLNAVMTDPPAYRFANLVGLEHYEWLSGGYLDGIAEREPKVIIVSR
jgi:hypothetical protein